MAFGCTKLKYQHFQVSAISTENMVYVASDYENLFYIVFTIHSILS